VCQLFEKPGFLCALLIFAGDLKIKRCPKIISQSLLLHNKSYKLVLHSLSVSKCAHQRIPIGIRCAAQVDKMKTGFIKQNRNFKKSQEKTRKI
jgi:hypothetical protein